jgi:hypothetical protein|tara:strand:+ start:632 stop:796 length:165 start_codon:yes stop_codon:yes gene_type:complete
MSCRNVLEFYQMFFSTKIEKCLIVNNHQHQFKNKGQHLPNNDQQIERGHDAEEK